MTCIPRVSLTDKAYGVRHKEVCVCGWSCILGLGGVHAVVSETYRKCDRYGSRAPSPRCDVDSGYTGPLLPSWVVEMCFEAARSILHTLHNFGLVDWTREWFSIRTPNTSWKCFKRNCNGIADSTIVVDLCG